MAECLLLGAGTTSNEAFHAELKYMQRTIIQEHSDHMLLRIEFIGLAKLSTHNSAAYHATAAQQKQSHLLSMICGGISRGFLAPFGQAVVQPVTDRDSLRAPAHEWDPDQHAARLQARADQAAMWDKEMQFKAAKKAKQKKSGIHVVKVYLKRTVFTKLI